MAGTRVSPAFMGAQASSAHPNKVRPHGDPPLSHKFSALPAGPMEAFPLPWGG